MDTSHALTGGRVVGLYIRVVDPSLRCDRFPLLHHLRIIHPLGCHRPWHPKYRQVHPVCALSTPPDLFSASQIRRARTAGAENENATTVRTSQAASRAKLPGGRAGLFSGHAKAAAGSTDAAVASSKTERENEEALASAKRKREALRELTARRNRGVKGKDAERRKILPLPKKSAVTAREPLRSLPVATENRPPVFMPPPAARARDSEHHRRSLIPVLTRVDDEQPFAKRLRTSSPALEEAEVQTALDALTDDDVEPADEPEADPDGDLWDDLDAADADEPTMASEYVVEIQLYLRQAEVRAFLPSPRSAPHLLPSFS
jgi:hypothetical protein